MVVTKNIKVFTGIQTNKIQACVESKQVNCGITKKSQQTMQHSVPPQSTVLTIKVTQEGYFNILILRPPSSPVADEGE